MSEGDIEIIEFIDLLDYTFSDKFVENWRYKYSTHFIKKFQFKLLQSISTKKPIKKTVIFKYLTTKCKYGEEQVDAFFSDIDLDIYYPIVLR